MTTNLIPFEFESQAVRVIDRDGEPWFALADVCRVLDIANVGNASARLDDDEKGNIHNPDATPAGGNPNITIINESGLYSLVLTSRKPAAKRFKKWVTADVLPTIRKTGAYGTPAAESPPIAPAIPTTAEAFAHAFTMIADAQKQQAVHSRAIERLEEMVDRVETAQTVLRCRPANAEGITHIRPRINRMFGLSSAVVDEVMRQSPYAPKPAGMVRNDHVDADGSLYAVYWQKDVTKTFERFVDECKAVTEFMFTHPFIEGRFRVARKRVVA